MKTDTLDPLARASTTPDVSALITEFDRALKSGPGTASDIAMAEATRYNWRNGKSTDGLLHQKNCAVGTTVRPYDHRPDCDMPLADETVNALVDLDMVALHNARVKPSATHATLMTAKQIAQVAALINWMRKGPLAKELIDDGELLSQVKNSSGWAVLHPCWKTRHGLRREVITIEQVMQLAAEAVQQARTSPSLRSPSPLQGEGWGEVEQGSTESRPTELPLMAQLPFMIADPAMEDGAVEVALQLYPYLKKKTARRIVRELREQGETEFLYREVQENGPSLRVLIPGINFFCAAETGKLARSRIIVTLENYSQAELEAMEVDDGWDPEFIAKAIKTAGSSSLHGDTNAEGRDEAGRNIEILTAYVNQVDEDGVRGIYCTVFSKFIEGASSPRPSPSKGEGAGTAGEAGTYAKHFLLDYAHGEYPFLAVRTEVTGLSPNDARGVSEISRTDQFAAKRSMDAVLIDMEMSTPSMLKRTGVQAKGVLEIVPGGVWQGAPGAGIEPLNLTEFSKPDLALKVIELISKRRNDYYGLPSLNTETHPARWQSRAQRNALRWLMPWGQAFWQLAVLCCDEYSPEELTAILGAPPLIDSKMLLKYQVQLQFDIRTLDNDWVIEIVKALAQYVLPFDRSGTVDLAKLTQWVMSSFDPTLAEEVTVNQQGAAQAVMNEVRTEVAWIMQGNEANYTQNDATAGMKLQYLQQIIASNPMYQMELNPQSPQFNMLKFGAMKKYEENLQHSVQETQISPTQGKLGITPGGMEQGPLQVLPAGPPQAA